MTLGTSVIGSTLGTILTIYLVILIARLVLDYVVIFEEDTPIELIKAIRPDVLIKGDDYKAEEVVGADVLKSYGGVVRLIPLRRGISTTKLVEKIRSGLAEEP